jgi:hypothetical protein
MRRAHLTVENLPRPVKEHSVIDIDPNSSGLPGIDPTNRLHAEFWQRTGQLHPDIDLDHNETTLPADHGGRVGTSTKWWI